MHNVDPDNNQSINSDYSTTNTILSQPLSGMNQALVTAYHAPG